MVAMKPRVVVVGAGMAGLTAAHRLHTTAPTIFDISVVEAGDRIGGRIFTSEFAGDRVEMGATWIHGIGGSPVYDIARKIHALHGSQPWERMDGYPEDAVTVAEGGLLVDPDLVASISTLYRTLMDTAKAGGLPASAGPGVGHFLRRGLHAYRAARRKEAGGEPADVGGRWTEESLEYALFAMNENTERTYTSADHLTKLNLTAESEYREFPGEQITIARGYSRVVEHLASALPPGTIRLGRKVRRVEWCPDGGEPELSDGPVTLILDDGSILAADHVLITVSLGILKAGIREDESKEAKLGVEFDPVLPDSKKGAIGRLGFGLVNKLFMEMEEGEEPFPFLELVFDQDEEGLMRRHVAKIPRWMRRTASICPIYGGSRVALAWLAGKEAEDLEKLADDEIIRGVHATLDGFSSSSAGEVYAKTDRRFSGSSGRVKRVARSRWGSDPMFMGSYSFVAVGSSGDDLDLMAEPLQSSPPLQILFAGEATHRTHYSTTHGAYFSGIREANRLIQHYQQIN